MPCQVPVVIVPILAKDESVATLELIELSVIVKLGYVPPTVTFVPPVKATVWSGEELVMVIVPPDCPSVIPVPWEKVAVLLPDKAMVGEVVPAMVSVWSPVLVPLVSPAVTVEASIGV